MRFAYRDAAGTHRVRRVEPHRQMHRHLRWYLLGWDLDRGDWRTYRTDRITTLTVPGTGFTPRPLPAETALDYLDQAARATRQRVVVDVDAPHADVVDALTYHDADIAPTEPARTSVTVWVESWQWLVLNLAMLDAPFTVIEPDTIDHACAAFARRLAHATSAGGASGAGLDDPTEFAASEFTSSAAEGADTRELLRRLAAE